MDTLLIYLLYKCPEGVWWMYLQSALLIQLAARLDKPVKHWLTKSSYITVAKALILAATVLKEKQIVDDIQVSL